MHVQRDDLIHPELCYKIIGVMYSVYNQLGSGHHEKYYQRAVAVGFQKENIRFCEQVMVPLVFNGVHIGRQFLDFLVEGLVVVELKRGENFPASNITQINSYLRSTRLKLGILVNFTTRGVKYRRIVNLEDSYISKN
ncbi:MAG: GxxExxY protein [Candidatus Doudnabacteria bacterium]|nr:GxxExxY protein [Candidatus Doudnabacteria bacterium]